MRADLIMEGVQEGRKALTKAVAPVTWGQDMDVPDVNPYAGVDLLAFSGGVTAAKIKTPGAIMSGWEKEKKLTSVIKKRDIKNEKWKCSG